MKRIKLVVLAVMLVAFILPKFAMTALIPGQMSAARRESKSIEECIDRFHELLYDEISNPTKRRKGGGGGYIDHDYQMAQVITALERVVNYYDKNEKIWRNNLQALEYMKKLYQKEDVKEAKEVLAIVIGYCGELEVQEYLIRLLYKENKPHIRAHAAQSLTEMKVIIAIPDFIKLLDDPYNFEAENCLQARRKKYLVRDSALFTLRKFGVNVSEEGESVYLVDKRSAVQVLEKGLTNVSDDRNNNLLEAIYRVGGGHARKSLENFVEKNKSQPEKKELVLKANELMLKIESDQSEIK